MLFSVSMFPTSKGMASVSEDVAKVVDLIDKSGLPYKLSAMSTVIEGDWDEVMPLLNKARLMLREKHDRIYMVLTMDDRKGATNRLTGKVTSVEKHLQREVSK
ncbi:MAG: MTH1187 family thiamine-binding protein [Candidatus Zixiibacteriota bacterium]